MKAKVKPNQERVGYPESPEELNKMKYEIAQEFGIEIPKVGEKYIWKMVPAYYCGLIGGEIVRRAMEFVVEEPNKKD